MNKRSCSARRCRLITDSQQSRIHLSRVLRLNCPPTPDTTVERERGEHTKYTDGYGQCDKKRYTN